jgi:hypothetical protein
MQKLGRPLTFGEILAQEYGEILKDRVTPPPPQEGDVGTLYRYAHNLTDDAATELIAWLTKQAEHVASKAKSEDAAWKEIQVCLSILPGSIEVPRILVPALEKRGEKQKARRPDLRLGNALASTAF